MPRELRKIPWNDEYIETEPVRSFHCGGEYWEREIEQWIKHDVVEERRRMPPVEVWLYYTDEDGLIGYGSLGESRWRWPLPSGRRVPISIIPAVGIDRRFWGQPEGPPEGRFSNRIMADLVEEARQRHERVPVIGLYVHPDNRRAMRLYERLGFQYFHHTYRNADGIDYISMVLKLG